MVHLKFRGMGEGSVCHSALPQSPCMPTLHASGAVQAASACPALLSCALAGGLGKRLEAETRQGSAGGTALQPPGWDLPSLTRIASHSRPLEIHIHVQPTSGVGQRSHHRQCRCSRPARGGSSAWLLGTPARCHRAPAGQNGWSKPGAALTPGAQAQTTQGHGQSFTPRVLRPAPGIPTHGTEGGR